MPNTLVHKRSSTASAVPSAGSLVAGELALNTADGRVYMKRDNGTVIDVGATRTHAGTHSSNGADPISPANIGAAALTGATFTGLVSVAPASGTGAGVIVQANGAAANNSVQRYSDDSTPPAYAMRKNRGTSASPTSVSANDQIGVMNYQTTNAAGTVVNIARILVSAAAAPVVGDPSVASTIAFSTASGAANLADRMLIDQSGNVGVGTNSPTALLDVNSNTMRLRTARTPASATAAGNAGDICWDASYLYICTATNTWRRIAHSTW